MRHTIISGVIAAAMFGIIAAAEAANPFAIQFPVAELGNCGSMEECRVYCDNPANGEACLSFAEKNGFVAKDDAARARKVIEKPGPGGCRGEACKTYCGAPEHSSECIDFAEKEGFMSKEQASEARTQSTRMNEPGPGGCKGEGECRNYCDDSAHLDECLEFGVEKGFMSAEEAARIRKISGNGPGGCKSKRECDTYCRTPEHGGECLVFAEENGLIPKEEAERARKMMNRTGPGGCRGESCRTYCDDSAHQEECIDFAVKEGMMPKEEAERAKKFAQATKEAGPGGCKGQQECGKYCGDPSHGEECFAFAKANGLVRPEEERRFEQSRGLNQKIQESGGPGGCKNESECMRYCGDPSHVNECLDFAEKSGAMSREEAQRGLEQFTQVREYREQVRQADPSQFRPAFGPGGSGEFGPPGGGFSPGRPQQFGPGSPASFNSGGGFPGMTPSQGGQFSGPGGCASPEECVDFCAKPENREACVATFRRGMPPPQRMDQQGQPGQGRDGMRPSGEFAPPMPQQGAQPENFPQGASDRPNMGQPPCNSPEECKAMEEQFRARMPQGSQGEHQFIPSREGQSGDGQFLTPNMPPRVDVQGQENMPPRERFAPPQGGFAPRPFEGQPQPPMPQEGFMSPQGNFAPPSGGFAPPPQDGMMPPPPAQTSGGAFVPSPMPMPAPMPEFGGSFAPPPSAPMPPPPADMPPPPPPPTSQLNPRSFIGLLYSALQGLIAK